MAISIPRTLVEFILLGPEDDRRQLQDSPILADVWVEFARNPAQRLELLITPYKERAAGILARELQKLLPPAGAASADDGPNIAYLHGIVAAALTFEEVLGVVVPMTAWWNDKRILTAIKVYVDDPDTMRREMEALRDEGFKWLADQSQIAIQDLQTRKRYAALAGLILWAQRVDAEPIEGPLKVQAKRILELLDVEVMVKELTAVMSGALAEAFPDQGELAAAELEHRKLVWTVSLNRRAQPGPHEVDSGGQGRRRPHPLHAWTAARSSGRSSTPASMRRTTPSRTARAGRASCGPSTSRGSATSSRSTI